MLGNWLFHHSKYAGCGDFHCFVCVSHMNLLCLSKLFAMLVRCSFRNMQRGHSNGCASFDSIYGIFETLRIIANVAARLPAVVTRWVAELSAPDEMSTLIQPSYLHYDSY
jgi:hypothetical protein